MRLPDSAALPNIKSSAYSAITPPVITSKHLIFATLALLAASAVLALLNLQKTRGLRLEIASSESARLNTERQRASGEKLLKDREAAVAAANAKFGDTENKVARTEAELVKIQAERNDLQAKLRTNETEIADLRKRVETAAAEPIAGDLPAHSIVDLQTQLEDARSQLQAAEREKILLSDKLKSTRDKSGPVETAIKDRATSRPNPVGVRGTVLATNQAYNFVVLSLGARQGVEANTEMLVLRGGSFIGKIRISSVEPATSIGDIISSTLARGVQVQPGDTVVYAGNNP
jgi:hypothetical protein